jgi:hypothetical protein
VVFRSTFALIQSSPMVLEYVAENSAVSVCSAGFICGEFLVSQGSVR